MKIICLSKRHPQGRDLYESPYGRFYYIPRLLAERGHEVHLLLLSYKHDPIAYKCEGNLHVHSISARPWGPSSYWYYASQLSQSLQPDWIVGFSDTWYGILAAHLSKKQKAHCLIDAYDNYESYIPWASPLHALWRRALHRADAVTAAGPQLADWMRQTAQRADTYIVPMAADSLFIPINKNECRQQLGLSLNQRLVGYAGSLHPNRGIGFLFDVFARLREIDPDIALVLSGRLAKGVNLPNGVHWLGYRPAEEVPLILNSLDLQFVVNKHGDFGDYSYPAKLYEAMACSIPVVASDVDGTRWVLREYPEMLARSGDIDDFVSKALLNLTLERFEYSDVKGWDYSANLIETILNSR